jgi:hypothetical protein
MGNEELISPRLVRWGVGPADLQSITSLSPSRGRLTQVRKGESDSFHLLLPSLHSQEQSYRAYQMPVLDVHFHPQRKTKGNSMGRKYPVLEISSIHTGALALGVPATEELGNARGLDERGGLFGVDIVYSCSSNEWNWTK